MYSEVTTQVTNDHCNNERNKKRREKRKKNKEKKELKSDIESATERILFIEKNIELEKVNLSKSNKREQDSSIATRIIIELLLSIELQNKSVPDCYSFYESQILQNPEMSSSDENYFTFEENTLCFHLTNGKNTKIKFSDKTQEIIYTFCREKIDINHLKSVWKPPNTIWSDKKGFGRGIKRKLSNLLQVPQDYGYSMKFFMKDIELYKNKKSSSSVNLWKDTKIEFDIDEAFEKFKSSVILEEDGFVSYDELLTFRDEIHKLKFNKLIVDHFGNKVERGFRRRNKRGFKGINFK